MRSRSIGSRWLVHGAPSASQRTSRVIKRAVMRVIPWNYVPRLSVQSATARLRRTLGRNASLRRRRRYHRHVGVAIRDCWLRQLSDARRRGSFPAVLVMRHNADRRDEARAEAGDALAAGMADA